MRRVGLLLRQVESRPRRVRSLLQQGESGPRRSLGIRPCWTRREYVPVGLIRASMRSTVLQGRIPKLRLSIANVNWIAAVRGLQP
jgi:hypothetical protein